jgi:hypothetical protein
LPEIWIVGDNVFIMNIIGLTNFSPSVNVVYHYTPIMIFYTANDMFV